MTPEASKQLMNGKEEKNEDDLEPGVDQPQVEINVDGEPIDPEDDEENRPSSQVSQRSKGTAEKKSDFDEDEGLHRSTLLETGEGEDGLLDRKSNEEAS